MMDRQRELYLEEAAELIVELEAALLELETSPQDQELIGRVFRALHTIKGSGAMFGFDAIAAFTHRLEEAFDLVREDRLRVTPDLINLTLRARDHIKGLLQAGNLQTPALVASGEQILNELDVIVAPASGQAAAIKPALSGASPAPPAPEGGEFTYRLRFTPSADILLSGTNPLLLLKELTQMGECDVLAHVDGIPYLEDFDPEQCYTRWEVLLTARAGEDEIRDVFIFVEGRSELRVDRLGLARELQHTRIGEILVERGDVSAEDLTTILEQQPKIGQVLVKAGLVPEAQVEAALLEQEHVKNVRERRTPEAATTLRVPASKLDNLVNVVGELVTVQARLSGHALRSGDPEMTFISEEVERLTEILRDNTMSLRMLPIGETFGRFRRLVHDLSLGLGKKVELVTAGAETELDKTVIEQLQDPLVHLIRNAIDHGIELPEQRLAKGKAETGRITLSASHSGAFVMITVSDDGAGLNREGIRKRAVERGIISAEAALSDQELDSMVLAPGFSTASKVTQISGRGVGLDVVKRSIDQLRGELTIQSSPVGTAISLRIPLTLAIIDGLLVSIGGCYYVVPLANIMECIELARSEGRESHDAAILHVRGELVPYIRLRERFRITSEPPAIEQVIIADTRLGKCGLVVDRVVGDHHTVIKKLGAIYREFDEVSGATILGDGTVALILDVNELAAGVLREQERRLANAEPALAGVPRYKR